MRAVRFARHHIVGAIVIQAVIAGRQLGGVADLGRQHGGAAGVVAAVGADHGVGYLEKVAAHDAIQVLAQLVLVVEGARQRDGHLAQRVLHIVQGAAAKFQQAAQRAAGQGAVRQHADGIARDIAHLDAVRVRPRRRGRQREAAIRHHQRLARADGNGDGIVGSGLHRRLDIFVQFRDQLVALVQQIVGLVADIDRQLGNRLVQLGELLGVGINHRHIRRDLRIDAVADLRQARAQALETRSERAGARQQRLARGDRRRIGAEVLHALEEVLQGGRQARRGVGQQVVDLADLRVIALERAGGALCGIDLGAHEAVVLALDLRHFRARADEAIAGKVRLRSLLQHRLAIVAGDIRIGDVMPGRRQAHLRCKQTALTDAE